MMVAWLAAMALLAAQHEAPAAGRLPPGGGLTDSVDRMPGECLTQARRGDRWTPAIAHRLAAEGHREVRVLRVGQRRTTDLRAGRINILLDAHDRIVAIRCG